jgi:O-acetyl-ADP-ribose deacetylase (regulator of RNase III)
MIEFVHGNLFGAEVEAFTNAVNCVGVMGKGIALEFKRRYPDAFAAYKQTCDTGQLRLGQVFVFDRGKSVSPRYIVHFPTKNHWRDSSQIEDIETGLKSLVSELYKLQIDSIAIPALGCGLGGLEWTSVRQEIETAFAACKTVKVLVFQPLEHNILAQSSQKGNFGIDLVKGTTDNQ